MKKIIAIALIAIVSFAAVFAAGNTVNVTATKDGEGVSFTLYGKKSGAADTEYNSSSVAIGTMGSAFTVDFKVSKSACNYVSGTGSITFTVTVNPLKKNDVNSGWVADKTMVIPTIGNDVTGGSCAGEKDSNNAWVITSSSISLDGYTDAKDVMTFSAEYTIPSNLYAGEYTSAVVLEYTSK